MNYLFCLLECNLQLILSCNEWEYEYEWTLHCTSRQVRWRANGWQTVQCPEDAHAVGNAQVECCPSSMTEQHSLLIELSVKDTHTTAINTNQLLNLPLYWTFEFVWVKLMERGTKRWPKGTMRIQPDCIQCSTGKRMFKWKLIIIWVHTKICVKACKLLSVKNT